MNPKFQLATLPNYTQTDFVYVVICATKATHFQHKALRYGDNDRDWSKDSREYDRFNDPDTEYKVENFSSWCRVKAWLKRHGYRHLHQPKGE